LALNKMGDEQHVGYRNECPACEYHCYICYNRAVDETKSRFLTKDELEETGGVCDYKCRMAEIKNNGLCYHCGRDSEVFSGFCRFNNCYSVSK